MVANAKSHAVSQTACAGANCDPAPLNEALWGKYQNWEK